MGEFKVCCWNVRGLSQNDDKPRQKIDYASKFDIFALEETWIEDDTNIPQVTKDNYHIYPVPAIPPEHKGRNSGGIIIGVRKTPNIKLQPPKILSKDISLIKFLIGQQSWQIVTVYSRKGAFEENEVHLQRIIDEANMEKNFLIMGDFNIRIGTNDGNTSQDTSTPGSHQKLINFKNKNGLTFLNGKLGDPQGKFTRLDSCSTRSNTVIDYMLVNDEAFKNVKNFYVDDSTTLSDHRPLIATIKY